MSDCQERGKKAWRTRVRRAAFQKAHQSEAASKRALSRYARKNGWKVAFFEGVTGAPRTGIVDAVLIRIASNDADQIDVRLVQLKGGAAGVSGPELSGLKAAVAKIVVGWVLAVHDGAALHAVPNLDDRK